jgi:anthranilate synthase component 1
MLSIIDPMRWPTREEFLRLAEGGLAIPVWRDLLADVETPLSAYWKLAHDAPESFLFESVTGGERLARYSYVGSRPRAVLRSAGGVLQTHEGERALADGEDPLHALRAAMRPALRVAGLPNLVGGAVGMLSYDLVRYFERLPDRNPDDLGAPDMAMMLCDDVVAFDHAKNLLRVIALAEPTEEGFVRARGRVDSIVERLRRPLPPLPSEDGTEWTPRPNLTREQYEAAVVRAKRYIAAGDVIQVVLSQRFSTKATHPVSAYRALRSLNPSPYMFLLRFGDFDVVGASPEILVSLTGNQARVRPIAGTRRRGETPDEDAARAADLLADEKELAEHVMLVDLGRNDVGRVARYGTVQLRETMTIERYSHVMHIVSDVVGDLREDLDAFDLVRACFPAGTVSGAPKVRAMQIIDELEPTRRGLYAGAVGYFAATGDADLAIAIRTILMKDGQAHVQAGAGIVFDSAPDREHDECVNKASAALEALRLASRGLDAEIVDVGH